MNGLVMQMGQAVLRHALTGAAGVLVADGYATNDQATQIVGGIMALIGVLWSMHNKQQHAAALAAATSEK